MAVRPRLVNLIPLAKMAARRPCDRGANGSPPLLERQKGVERRRISEIRDTNAASSQAIISVMDFRVRLDSVPHSLTGTPMICCSVRPTRVT